MRKLRIGRRRAQSVALSPRERAVAPALEDGRWQVPDKFNFTRDVVEALAPDPKREALRFAGTDGIIEPRTFAQLADGASRWAAILRQREIRPGDRVVVLTGMTLDWIEVVLGCLKVGAVVVPSSPGASAAAIEVVVSASGASLLVTDDVSQAEVAQMSFAPDVHHVNEGHRRRVTDVTEPEPSADTSSRDLAFVAWTPGTAGRPKVVAHTNASLFASRVQAEHWLDAGPGDVVWCTAGSSSALAVWTTLAGPWGRGAEVVLHDGAFDPMERLDLLHRLRPTILCQTPEELRGLAERRELVRFRSPRLRRLVSTGDFLDPEVTGVFEAAWGMTVHDGYGQSETNVVVANGPEAEFRPGSIGRPLPGYHVAVIDPQGDELPPGIEGDVAVRGRPPTLFAGYWEAPDDTRMAFRGDWYMTGDVATVDEDGFFWLLGRAEDVIASRGRTFGPFEVERVLRSHAAVAASAVVGVRDLERGGHYVRAFVVPREGLQPSEQLEAELRQYVGETLLEHQVPREIEFVDGLPRSATGAIRRDELRDRPAAGRPLWETTSAAPEATVGAVAAAASPPVVEPPAQPVVAPVVAPTPDPLAEPLVAPPGAVEPVVEPIAEPVGESAEPVVVEAEPALPVVEAADPPPALLPDLPAPAATPTPTSAPAPEPPVEPAAEAAPEPEPAAAPEPVEAQEPAAAPEVEPPQEAAADPKLAVVPPEASPSPDVASADVVEREPEPLPDYIVGPADRLGPVTPPPPEPEPEEKELGPLPEYVVDPERRLEPVPGPRSDPPPEAPAPEEPETPLAGLGLPPVTFPTPSDDAEAERARPQAGERVRRPLPPEDERPSGRPSEGEPGDDAEEVGWMEGLSSRLSAYSLDAEARRAAAEEHEDTAEEDTAPEDAEREDAAPEGESKA